MQCIILCWVNQQKTKGMKSYLPPHLGPELGLLSPGTAEAPRTGRPSSKSNLRQIGQVPCWWLRNGCIFTNYFFSCMTSTKGLEFKRERKMCLKLPYFPESTGTRIWVTAELFSWISFWKTRNISDECLSSISELTLFKQGYVSVVLTFNQHTSTKLYTEKAFLGNQAYFHAFPYFLRDMTKQNVVLKH